MERHSRNLRSQVGKTPIQKPLCRLCECPTSDGHVLASQVDRLKLRKWAMKVMNLTERDENLPDVVEKHDLICYFCIWQAEFGDESGDEAVAWWPKNLDLEENANVLRENYSVGAVEQCWVQLEEVDLAKHTKEVPENKPFESYNIRCEFCKNIKKCYPTVQLWRLHVRRMHPEYSVECTRVGCNEFFKSKPEMILHVNSWHERSINQDLFQCKHCEFSTTIKYSLKQHVEAKHMPKMFKCDSCDAKFGSKIQVNKHVKQTHTFDECKSCGQDVAFGMIATHRKPSVCFACKVSFKCFGLYQLHWKSCKQTVFRCKKCGKPFDMSWKVKRHVRQVHSKIAKFRCCHCDHSAYDKNHMTKHMESKHFPRTIKCGECNLMYASESILKIHKRMSHEYVRCAECSQEIRRQNMNPHRTTKTCCRCKRKFKCGGFLEKHLKSCLQVKK